MESKPGDEQPNLDAGMERASEQSGSVEDTPQHE